MPAKIFLTASMLKLFGQAGWEQVRDGFGNLSSFDLIFGKIKPNYDLNGQFETPAWTQFHRTGTVEFENVDDIVYFVLPDIDGYMTGGSDIEALTAITLASDLLAALANQSLLENIGAPDGIFSVDSELGDDAYEQLRAEIYDLFQGPANYGRSMIVAQGLLNFLPYNIQRDMQWGESREFNRQDISAATGVSSGQLGMAEGLSRANLGQMRRQFWDTTTAPLCRLIESGVNEQVFQRDLKVWDWCLKFQTPEFQTEGEKTYNAVRRISYAVSSPNEEAARMGYAGFPGGDLRLIPGNMRILGEEANAQGPPAFGTHPLQGRPRGGEKVETESDFEAERKELANWLRICKAMVRDGDLPVTDRRFEPKSLPPALVEWGHDLLSEAGSMREIEEVFDDLFAIYR